MVRSVIADERYDPVGARMSPRNQCTIARAVEFEGQGIHTGEAVRVTFEPAPIDHGLVFRRTDVEGSPTIPVRPECALYDRSQGRRTILSHGGVQVHTTEHLLAAVTGLGIDNLTINISGIEAPEPEEGGTRAIVDLLDPLREEQAATRVPITLTKPVVFRDGDIEITAVPADSLRLSYTVTYDDPLIGSQHLSLSMTPEVFKEQVAAARTFVLHRDVERLRAAGLIRGGTLANALVVNDGELMNDEPLRFPDEFVRHKILDLCGDLALLGRPLNAHIIAVKAGHESHVAFVKKLDAFIKRQHTPYSWVREPLNATNMPVPRDPAVDGFVFNLPDILRIMPHRYPFLLVDRILEMTSERIVGIKNVTINEPFFQGHFPGQPVMPGVLLIEAMAQVGGVMLLNTVKDPEGKLVYFLGIDKARFRHMVTPGDQVRFVLTPVRLQPRLAKMRGEAFVEDRLVAEADLMSTVIDP